MEENINIYREKIIKLLQQYESMTMGDIAQHLRTSAQGATELVLNMYRDGLLIKDYNPPKYRINHTNTNNTQS